MPKLETHTSLISCPDCGGVLNVTDAAWRCESCDVGWQVDSDGVALLNEKDYFFGSNQDEMRRLLEELRCMTADDLEAETERLEREYKDFSHGYCLNPARADWTMLGDFHNRTVLDVGCGFGSVSIPLAATAQSVISVDATLERIRFLSQIKRIKGLDNVVPVHGDITRLPVGLSAIERIVMVGVLEYAGHFYPSGSPRALQVQFLKYLRERLTSNGELWIGIENWLSPRHFLGRTYHEDIPFTPLMPAWAANGLTKLVRREPYRLHLASERGYRRMLAEAGFGEVEFYYAITDYRYPRFITSSASDAIISHYINSVRHRRKSRSKVGLALIAMADRLHLAGVFCPCFFIRASKA